jgi:deaminated glutathione amidase
MSIRVALIQMESGPSKDENLAFACARIEEAAKAGARVVGLPEYFTYLGPEKRYREIAEPVPGPVTERLTSLAVAHDVYVHAGSMVEPIAGDTRFFNTSLLITPGGDIRGLYRKVHLFDIDVPDQVEDQESAYIAPGDGLCVVELPEFVAGMSICFDVRFPELYRSLAAAGATVLFVPAAFAQATGRVHWKILLQARAIENHAYVLAAGQHGDKSGSPMYGHSMIVDPWGAVLAEYEQPSGIIYADLDPDEPERRRQQVPVLTNRFPEVYAKPVRVERISG